MVSKRVEEALNKQISLEGNSSQFYLAMASWAESQGYNGTAEFLYRQTDEERQHMLKLIRYVNERGGTAKIPSIDEPPVEFEWRYEIKKKGGDKEGHEDEANKSKVEQERLSKLRIYTPQVFYEEFVGVDLTEFVCLYNDAAKPTGKHYSFSRARNIFGERDMHFVNVEIGEMKEIAVKSVLANQPMWFAVNMGVDQSGEHGLMEHELFDYEALFGVDMPLSKAQRTRFNAGASNHAMVLTGVDLQNGKPKKWLVENSWGTDKGNKGHWTLYDRWFDEHVYTVIVHRAHVPKEILDIFEEAPEVLPAWYPGAMGIQYNP